MRANHRRPDDAREWLRRARSSLLKAQKASNIPGVYLEDLCFDAQQAAEKALKAVLIHQKQPFPHVHDLGVLLDQLERIGLELPEKIKQAAILTDYAVAARYPGALEPVTKGEYAEAVAIAEQVLQWAHELVASE